MKRFFLLLLVVLSACNISQKDAQQEKLQKLVSMLPIANWRITGENDTSYIYFSRQVDNTYKTYEYKLVRGDSIVTLNGAIRASGDSVVWNWNNHLLELAEISDSISNWKERSVNEIYTLQKINDSSLELKSSGRNWLLTRTLPLSTFLVRAKFDYEHGTKLSDSAEIPPKKLITK